MLSHDFKEVIQFRKKFHKYPELAWREFWTTSEICTHLEEWGYTNLLIGQDIIQPDLRRMPPSDELLEQAYQKALDYGAKEKYLKKMKGGYTGVVAIMDSGKKGPTIGFRGDIDALPIPESADDSHRPMQEGFRSINEGLSHACGHDCHTSIALSIAHYIAANIDHLAGKFVIIFSAAEEGGGACYSIAKLPIIDELQYIYCYHVIPLKSRGHSLILTNVMFRTLIEYTATFRIKPFHVPLDRPLDQIEDVNEWANAIIRHENAHPPTRTIDVNAAAHAIHLIQTLPQPQDFSSEVNIEKFHTQLEGEVQWERYRKEPVCRFAYQIRSSTDQRAEMMRQRIEELLKSVAKIYNVEIEINGPTQTNYPALERNHMTFQNLYKKAWTELGHEHHWIDEPLLDIGTDDVIYILNKVDQKGGSAAYMGLACDDQDGKITSLHTPVFDFPDKNLVDGVKAAILVLHKILDQNEKKKV